MEESVGSSGIGYHCLALTRLSSRQLRIGLLVFPRGHQCASTMKNLWGKEAGHSLEVRCLRDSCGRSSVADDMNQ